MFTVLMRFTKDGREVVYLAKSVEFIPPAPKVPPCESGLYMSGPGDHVQHFSPGNADEESYADVYVMNEGGKTVAHYIL